MASKTDEIKKEIWTKFQDFPCVYLATEEGNQPRVRPVTLIYFGEKLWISTGTKDAKIRQLRQNSNIEFCMPFDTEENAGYVRVAGCVKIVKDEKIKCAVADHLDFFYDHWESHDDPNYTLLQITPEEIEYLSPEHTQAEFFLL